MKLDWQQIPIITQAVYFLNEAGKEKGIILTEKGFLGRNFVQAFWDEHLSSPDEMPFRPTRELECPEATRIHSLLTESKYVRKFKGVIQLTPKGRLAIEKNSFIELYRDLLEVGMFQWNWGFEDRYPDFDFIQGSAPRLIETLMHWPHPTVSAKQLFENVFGETLETVKSPSHNLDSNELIFDLGEQMISCLNVRLFHRFCVPFGILRDVSGSGFNWKIDDPFEKTEFFFFDFSKVLVSGNIELAQKRLKEVR